MGSNRYSLDSHINFLNKQGSTKQKNYKTSSARSTSLTNSQRCQISDLSNSLLTSSHKNSKSKLTKSSLQNNFGKRPQKDSPSTTSGASSINSLFIMNRVKSFTWKLRRQLIQTSIETDSIPPEVLYPTKLGVSLDNFILLQGKRSCSCDASTSVSSMKQSSGSMKLKSKTRNSSLYQQDSKTRLRHSMDSSIQKKEIVCSHDDFKSIMYSRKDKINLHKASSKRDSYKNSKRRNVFNTILNISKSPNCGDSLFKNRRGNSCHSNFQDSFVKFNMPYKFSSVSGPRRSLSDGSLNDLRQVAFEIGDTVLDFRMEDKTSLLPDSGRLDEIEEIDREVFDKSQSQESIYNFTLPNIQILGDAIQQHLKVLMGIQFKEVDKSPIPSVFELATNDALVDRIYNSLRHMRLNCCC